MGRRGLLLSKARKDQIIVDSLTALSNVSLGMLAGYCARLMHRTNRVPVESIRDHKRVHVCFMHVLAGFHSDNIYKVDLVDLLTSTFMPC